MIGIPEMIAYFPRERMTGQALTMKSIFLRHYERRGNSFFSLLSLRTLFLAEGKRSEATWQSQSFNPIL